MIRRFIEGHKALCLIVSLAVIVHIAVFFTLKTLAVNHPNALHSAFPVAGGGYDPIDYTTLASNILHYGNFSMESGAHAPAEAYRTPGYPFFMAVVEYVTGSVDTVPFFQIILLALSALIAYFIVLEIFPAHRKIALVVVALFLFDPVIFFSSEFITTESLYTLFLLLSVYLLVKRSASPRITYGCAGIVLGLSALARPSGLFMVVPIGIWIIIRLFKSHDRKVILIQTGIFLLGFIFVVFSWCIRNGIRTGVYEFSSLPTYNTMFNLPVYLSYKDKKPVEAIRADLNQKIGGLSDSEQRDLRNGALMRKVEWEILKPNLLSYTFFHVSKSANFFLAPGSKFTANFLQGFWEGQQADSWHPETSFVNSLIERRWGDILTLVYQNILYLPESVFLLCMFVFGLYWSLFSRLDSAKLIFGLVLFLGLLTSPITNPRYRVPVLPFVYFSGIAGISLAVQKYRARSIRLDKDAS